MVSSLATAQIDTREQRLIDHARYCLVNDIIVGSLNDGATLDRARMSCRAGELGLAFIGERSSQRSLEALAGLRRYVLDGAVGESYSCYVLSKGDKVLTLLKKLNPQKEHQACEAEVTRRAAELGLNAKDVNLGGVCASPGDVTSWVKDMSAAVGAHRQCDPQDW
ncbi:MAG: Imm57 family immunity protein [Steroidobacteraceae bacterium]